MILNDIESLKIGEMYCVQKLKVLKEMQYCTKFDKKLEEQLADFHIRANMGAEELEGEIHRMTQRVSVIRRLLREEEEVRAKEIAENSGLQIWVHRISMASSMWKGYCVELHGIVKTLEGNNTNELATCSQ